MRSVGGERDELAIVEHGDDDADVGRVARAVVRVIVDHHVAVLPAPALQRLANALEVAGHRRNAIHVAGNGFSDDACDLIAELVHGGFKRGQIIEG